MSIILKSISISGNKSPPQNREKKVNLSSGSENSSTLKSSSKHSVTDRSISKSGSSKIQRSKSQLKYFSSSRSSVSKSEQDLDGSKEIPLKSSSKGSDQDISPHKIASSAPCLAPVRIFHGYDPAAPSIDYNDSRHVQQTELLDVLESTIIKYSEASTKEKPVILVNFKNLFHNLENGYVNMKIITNHTRSLLYVACRRGCTEIVKILLGNRDINLGGIQYESKGSMSTPLHGANWGGYYDIVAMLLYKGAQPEENDCIEAEAHQGFYPYQEINEALPESTTEKMALLWENFNNTGVLNITSFLPPDWPSENKLRTSLSSEAKSHQAMVNQLCNIMTDHYDNNCEISEEEFNQIWQKFDHQYVNQPSIYHKTLLYVACRCRNKQIVKTLLQIPGIQVNGLQEGWLGSTPLHGANWACDPQIVAMLISSGAVPEKNKCFAYRKDGLYPYEEENTHNVDITVLNKMKELWNNYRIKGVEGVKEYLPEGWIPVLIISSQATATEIPVGETDEDSKYIIQGFTFEDLINQLISPDTTDVMISEFFITYRSFSSPTEVIQSLIYRCNNSTEEKIHHRAIMLIRTWIEKHRNDFIRDKDLILEKLNEWLKSLPDTLPQSKLYTWVNSIITSGFGSPVKPNLNCLPNFYMDAPKAIVPLNLSKLTLLNLHPLEIARQLTLIEETLWNDVDISECFGMEWTKPETRSEKAPTITEFIQWFNKVNLWVKTQILVTENIKDRVKLIQKFISVAEHCMELHNYTAVLEIISAINSGPVRRLKKTFAFLIKRSGSLMDSLDRLSLLQEKNYKKIRETLRTVEPPCIPYLGMYLTDLVFIEEGNKDNTYNGLINWSKRRMVAGTIREIQHFQQTRYCLTRIPAMRDFIKERIETVYSYTEDGSQPYDDTLYEFSNFIEPKENTSIQILPAKYLELRKLVSESESDTNGFVESPNRKTLLENTKTLPARNVQLDLNLLPPVYHRIKYTFYYEDENKQQKIYDSYICYQLSKAYSQQMQGITLQMADNSYYFDFISCQQTFNHNNNNLNEAEQSNNNNIYHKTKKFFIYQRISSWFWRDDDGTLKPYKHSDIIEFSNLLSKGQTISSMNIGKHSYEIDLSRKKQKNISFGTERDIYTEEDIEHIMQWNGSPFEFPDSPPREGLASLINLDQNSEEFKKVEKMFYLYVPSTKKKVSVSVLERQKKGKFKSVNSIVKISKIFNPKLRTTWYQQLGKKKSELYPDQPDTIRFLFYGSNNASLLSEISLGKGISPGNIEGSDSCILSQEPLYFNKTFTSPVTSPHSPKPQRDQFFARTNSFSGRREDISNIPLKQVILAEVIVGEEYLTDNGNITNGLSKDPDSLVTVYGQKWLWYLPDPARAYPLYIIDWN